MKSIRARLTWGYALVVLITVVAAIVVGYFLLLLELIRGIDMLNFAEFREIRDRVEVANRPVAEDEFIRSVAGHAEIDAPLYFFQVSRDDGRVLFRSPNMGSVIFDARPEDKTNRTISISTLGFLRIGHYREGNYLLQIATSLRSIRQFSATYLQVSFVVSAIAVILSIFFGYRLSRLALDPIRRIQRTAEHISADNLSTRIPGGKGNDEIAGLVRLLNQMFDRLERSFDRLGRFASEASHELKTPLSLIRLQSEKLLLHGNLSTNQQEVIQQQLEGINRLDAVIEKLLFLAKSKVGGIHPNTKLQDAAEFIRQFDEDARVLCEDQNLSFEVVRNEPLLASFDATLLRHVLLNLLTNAVRVTPEQGRITLSSFIEGKGWKVQVEDSGAGLPETQVERIFEPFARLPSDGRSVRGDGGTGLGLAICRSVLEVHGGIIHAGNRRPGPGLCVTFELPIVSKINADNPDTLKSVPSLQPMGT